MKGLIAIVVLTVATLVAGWWFFTFGGKTIPSLTDEQKTIVQIQDRRLSRGSPNAPVKIIDYVDVLCPFCAKANQPGDIIPRMAGEYVDTKKAHYEIRLVAKTSPDSKRAGQGAYCAAEQDKFWEYLNTAYEDTWVQYYSQGKDVADVLLFQENMIYSFAKKIPGLDAMRWQACLGDNDYANTMEDNAKEMIKLEAYGTPTMVVDGKSHTGTPPYSAFQAVINASLNQKKQEAADAQK